MALLVHASAKPTLHSTYMCSVGFENDHRCVIDWSALFTITSKAEYIQLGLIFGRKKKLNFEQKPAKNA